MIIEWTRDEEAKYQASLVSKEVERFKSDSTESRSSSAASTRPNSKKSKTKSPSPDKAPKKKPAEKGKCLFLVEFNLIYLLNYLN